MPNFVLHEGSLKFHFIEVNFASQYDGWQHYRTQFQKVCNGSKAVDFVVVKEKTVWLIEVKDYRVHNRTKPSELVDEICLKVRDTLAGLVSACYLGAVDQEVQQSKTALQQKKIRVILHLEQTKTKSRLLPNIFDLAYIQMKLQQVLKFADMHPEVCSADTFPAILGKVER